MFIFWIQITITISIIFKTATQFQFSNKIFRVISDDYKNTKNIGFPHQQSGEVWFHLDFVFFITSDGDVGNAVLSADVDGVRNDAIEWLGDHWKVRRVLEELQRGGIHIESVLQKEVHCHPREAPEPLHPDPEPEQLPDRVRVRAPAFRRDHWSSSESRR